MMNSNSAVLGIDIGSGDYQICYYKSGMSEPQLLINAETGGCDFSLSAYIFKDPISDESTVDFGRISNIHSRLNPEHILENIFTDDLGGTGYSRQTVLALFIRHCFVILADSMLSTDVRAISFTSRKLEAALQGEIRRAVNMLSIDDCNVFIEDYMESYYHYLIRQKKTAFEDRSVIFYRADDEIIMGSLVFRNRLLESSVSSNEMATLMLPRELSREEKDAGFSQFINNRLSNVSTSSIFVVADDLVLSNKNELPKSFAALTGNRGHVFVGNNLFVQGTAYSGFDKLSGFSKSDNYLGDDRIGHDIYVEARAGRSMSQISLASAEQKFYDVNSSVDIIARSTDVFTFYSKSLEDGTVKKHELIMNGIPDRPEYTTRLRVRLSFADSNELMLEVSDLGFGSLFAASGLVFKDVFSLK